MSIFNLQGKRKLKFGINFHRKWKLKFGSQFSYNNFSFEQGVKEIEMITVYLLHMYDNCK